MTTPTRNPEQGKDEEARRFYETLKANDQVRDVAEHEDTSKLPNHVTHVRYANGTIKRIRFTSAGHR